MRTVLSRYAPFSPDVWRFTSNEHGKPEIAGHDVPCDLRFNVAHSEDVVLLAVSRGREVGVDVEALGTGNAYLGVAERFFARTEMGALQAQRRDAHAAAFLEFWTLKEAYVKARGRGLSLALDSFAFALGADIEFSGENSCADADARWWFSQLLPAARYVAAVCAETDVRSAPTLTLRRVVPLGVEQLIECAVIRQSRMND